MKKKWPFITVGIFLLVGVLGSMLVLRRPNTTVVEIIQDDTVLYQMDLSQTEDQIIEVEYKGRMNRIEIQNHQIHMLEADCPDHTCINMGWLRSTVPVICLPNHLVIRFVDGTEGIDAITQ